MPENSYKSESNVIKIEGVGQVLFERSSRAKCLNISLRPFKGIRVAVPHGLSFKKAEKLVHSKVGWLQKHLIKMKQVEERHKQALENPININKVAARRKLVNRLTELAEEYGFNHNKVSIRNQKTRWGSCSADNNISLNMKLVLVPDELIDYVILHELVHTRVKSHSKEFWDELDRFVGNAKALSLKLKKYSMAII